MSEKERIKTMVKEAEIYRTQGLFDQSKEKYLELIQFIKNNEQLSKDKKLIDAVNKKLQVVEDALTEIDEATDTPQLSEDLQNLIGQLFSSSKNKDTAAIEGAVALAKFGQYEKAVTELQRLIKEGNFPLLAAKNLLRCQLNFESPDAAIVQFNRWVHRDELSKGDLKHLKGFFEKLLGKKGIKADLSQVAEGHLEKGELEEQEEDDLEISSVSFQLEDGPRKGQEVEFDVSFHSGDTISIFIPANQKDVVDSFKPGIRL
ncbi:MAG: hypothetical protein JRI52_05445, partial [Deltaproteobacteria bacterium]|nr:hypothetical protein [Deltaproteobacteria bacterium]